MAVKATASASLALTASVATAAVASNGHAPSTAPTLAPSVSLDTLASALAPRDATAPCPCDWIGASYAERCAWLLAAVRDTRQALDSWRSATLAELAATAALAATPDTARDLECYTDGLRHGLRLMGAIIEDAYVPTSATVAPVAPTATDTLWDAGVATDSTDHAIPWAPDALLPGAS